MTHLLLLVKKQTLTLGECQHGSYSPFLYKGNEEEYWPDKDSLFWEGFWKYVFKEKRLGPDDQIALSIIFHADEADIPKIKKIIAWPWQERIASLRMQPIWQILPELVCKEGLLKENSPLYVAWNGATWQINAQGAEPTTSQISPYSFEDQHIANCFAAPWPVLADKITPTKTSGNPHTALARYVATSKIKSN